MCQFLAVGSAFSVQYPSGSHPMGADVSHHHSHSDNLNSQDEHHHGPMSFNATEPVPSADSSLLADSSFIKLVLADAAGATEAEHEHANHSHMPSHPPEEPLFVSRFFQTEILSDDDITYLNCRYAPPIPPPHT